MGLACRINTARLGVETAWLHCPGNPKEAWLFGLQPFPESAGQYFCGAQSGWLPQLERDSILSLSKLRVVKLRYCESFNGKLRDECLNGEIFYSLKEANVVIQQWRKHYNTIRPHSSLNYRSPAPQTSAPERLHLDQSAPMQ